MNEYFDFLFFIFDALSPLISACIIGLLISNLIIKIFADKLIGRIDYCILPLITILGYVTLSSKLSDAAFGNELIRMVALLMRLSPILISLIFFIFNSKSTFHYFKWAK
jgi:hypothetical protein